MLEVIDVYNFKNNSSNYQQLENYTEVILELMDTSFGQDLKCLALNSKEPFIIKGILDWDILEWNLEQWSQVLNSEELEFRCGKYKHTTDPQWERTTQIIKGKFDDLTNVNVKDSKKWLYFDYKYLNRYLKNKMELQNSISWEKFGFPEYNSEDSTLWIGTEGAHTPCHKDTYGCNLVAQIYGRKRWILFPPHEDLSSTRVPYEESSIYSKLNFFSPYNIGILKNIKRAKSIVLQPGEVLFVPNGWWHYVENLEVAISINIWIPLSTDRKHQLKESLVQMFISQVIKDIDRDKQKNILNPNMEELHLETQNVIQSLDVINVCKRNCLSSEQFDPIVNLEELFEKHATSLHRISDLSKIDLSTLLQNQADRFTHDGGCGESESIEDGGFREIIDVFTNEDVIDLVVEKLLNRKS